MPDNITLLLGIGGALAGGYALSQIAGGDSKESVKDKLSGGSGGDFKPVQGVNDTFSNVEQSLNRLREQVSGSQAPNIETGGTKITRNIIREFDKQKDKVKDKITNGDGGSGGGIDYPEQLPHAPETPGQERIARQLAQAEKQKDKDKDKDKISISKPSESIERERRELEQTQQEFGDIPAEDVGLFGAKTGVEPIDKATGSVSKALGQAGTEFHQTVTMGTAQAGAEVGEIPSDIASGIDKAKEDIQNTLDSLIPFS